MYLNDDSIQIELAMGFRTTLRHRINRPAIRLVADVINDGRFIGSFNLVTGELFVEKIFVKRIEYVLLIMCGFDTSIVATNIYSGQAFQTINGRRIML